MRCGVVATHFAVGVCVEEAGFESRACESGCVSRVAGCDRPVSTPSCFETIAASRRSLRMRAVERVRSSEVVHAERDPPLSPPSRGRTPPHELDIELAISDAASNVRVLARSRHRVLPLEGEDRGGAVFVSFTAVSL